MTTKRPTRQAVHPVPDAQAASRVGAIDAARGFAVAMMIAYHFCFDLTYFGWADWAMLVDGRWIAWRSTIVASFLFVVGVSLALRDSRSRTRRPLDRSFVKRWLQIALAAALVTAGSAVLFPQSFIYFGVLHFVAVAVVACRRAPRLGPWAVPLGCAVIAIGLGASDAAFNPRFIDWIGFATEKPKTEDYVPLFPWLGVVLIGCGVGGRWARTGFRVPPPIEAAWNAIPATLRRVLAAMGRWSLTIYLVHQPLLLGTLGLLAQTR